MTREFIAADAESPERRKWSVELTASYPRIAFAMRVMCARRDRRRSLPQYYLLTPCFSPYILPALTCSKFSQR
jgi:hypothetical protein